MNLERARSIVGEAQKPLITVVGHPNTMEAVRQAKALTGGGPFRAPHFSASPKALRDEVALADGGALYLLNLEEFRQAGIEAIAGALNTVDVQLLVGERPSEERFAAPRWDKHMETLRRAMMQSESVVTERVVKKVTAELDGWVLDACERLAPRVGARSTAQMIGMMAGHGLSAYFDDEDIHG